MNALVKKEIRLLLPGWLAVLLLEVVLPWLWYDVNVPIGVMPFWYNSVMSFLFFLGMILLALDSFGREFSLGTFQSLLSQPIERRQIWRTKIMVLLFAAALIFAAYFASCELRFHHGLKIPAWQAIPTLIESDFRNLMFGSGVALLVALAGGLWTVLLLRQTAAAFWITILAPAWLLTAIMFFFPDRFSNMDKIVETVLYSAAGLYTVFGFWLAHRLFHQAQDVAWTGGIISFSTWRYFESGSRPSGAVRRRRPVTALFRKEFQLHSVSLICACALLALHIGVFFLRILYVNSHRNSLAAGVSDFFWALWLVMPLVIGCTAVAEERKLGMADGQFCLPVSRRAQFAIKFIPAMIFGTLLGGVMPMLLEAVAAHFGAPNEFFKLENYASNDFFPTFVWFQISIVALAAGMSAAAFFASTLARSFLQALSIAIVIAMGCCLVTLFIMHIWQQHVSFFGIIPWPWALPILIAIPTVAVLYLWLACRNFSRFLESRRLWRDNLLGIMEALAFITVSSAVIYNRPWEIFEPAEPPHGPAIFSPANPPKLNSEYRNLLVRMPDGRVWFDSLKYSFEDQPGLLKDIWYLLIQPSPKSAGPRQFIAGSNWVSATALRVWDVGGTTPSKAVHVFGYLDTVGVKSNGTLWISSESKPEVWTGGKMMQFGDETNWQQVAQLYREGFGNFLLLKNDGTLWRWGTNRFDWNGLQTNWPTVRALNPRQIGTNSDWKEISYNAVDRFVRKTDGSVWSVFFNEKTGRDEFERQTNLDQVVFETFSHMNDARMAYIGKDGTLWVCNGHSDGNYSWKETGFLQVGKETHWLAVAVTWPCVVALKSDGSLWKWNFPRYSTAEVAKVPPTRLGIHNDWVSLTGALGGAVSLAADGSLWLWPGANYYGALKDPKQPQFLGNVFGKSD
jgi:ABC-type transport system involved in multi-copper enzyme maturation permease subunit